MFWFLCKPLLGRLSAHRAASSTQQQQQSGTGAPVRDFLQRLFQFFSKLSTRVCAVAVVSGRGAAPPAVSVT